MNPFLDLYSVFRLIKIYKKIQPDILHHVALKPAILGTISAKFIKVDKIINALGGLGWVFTSKLIYAKFIKVIVKYSLSKLLKQSNMIIQNKYDAKILEDLGFENNVSIIEGVGIDHQEYLPKKHNESNSTKIALIGRMLKDKGVLEYVEMAKRVKKKYNEEVVFFLVGRVDLLNPSNIKKTKILNWQDKGVVQYIEWVNNMNVFLNQIDIVCLPSYREGLPHALVEAMASGLPIITTDVPGCNSMVKKSKNGYLVQPRDSNSLIEATMTLIKDKRERKRMGENSRKISLGRFDKKIIFKQILSLYQ